MRQHFERENLPADVLEIFFSGKWWYAASTQEMYCGRNGYRPAAVGCGHNRQAAIDDMRKLIADMPKGEKE